MEIKYDQERNITTISKIKEFDLIKTLESGQTFRYFIVEDVDKVGAVVIDGNDASYIESIKEGLIVHTTQKFLVDKWISFFNLDVDYSKIKRKIIKLAPNMEKIILNSSGVRIIKTNEWDAIVTFILSSNNNMVRIKKLVNLIAETYGAYIGNIQGIECYAIPTPKELSKVKVEELRKLGVGFRDRYLIDAALKVCQNEFSIDYLKSLDDDALKQELMKINGVGNKVADCIRLFGFNKMKVFPVDVWIERFMLDYFLNDGKKYSRDSIEKYGIEKFNDMAGYAQQYMFYFCVTEYKNILENRR